MAENPEEEVTAPAIDFVVNSPPDVLRDCGGRVLKRSLTDYVSVCQSSKAWRQSLADVFDVNKLYNTWPGNPFLMTPSPTEKDTRLRLRSLEEVGVHTRVDLPEGTGRWFRQDCRYGCLVLHHQSSGEVLLYSILGNLSKSLPDILTISTRPICCGPIIRRAVLSANPRRTSPFTLAVITAGGDVRFWDCAANHWKPVQFLDGGDRAVDLVFHRVDGYFCVLGNKGFYRLNLEASSLTLMYPHPLWTCRSVDHHLCDTPESGQILLIGRVGNPSATTGFKVWRVWINMDYDREEDEEMAGICEALSDLKGEAIFVGHSATFTVASKPDTAIQPDSVYFCSSVKTAYRCGSCRVVFSVDDDGLQFGRIRVERDAGIYSLPTEAVSRFPTGTHLPIQWVNLGV